MAHPDHIVRQTDPELRAVVEHLARGHVAEAVRQLDAQGRVHEIPDRATRLHAIADAFVADPQGTLVISPDNHSRVELNARIHHSQQTFGNVDRDERLVRILVPRQDLTGADRQWAARYEVGNVVRYTTGSRMIGLEAGAYAELTDVNPRDNRLTVQRPTGARVTYDPCRIQGVTLYRTGVRPFARGDRIRVTAPDRLRRVANRDLGTLVDTRRHGELRVRFDSGRTVSFPSGDRVHLDFGYAVTSHSSQGQTADRVLVHVETDRTGALVNRRLAYVALSRGRHDAQLYTNNRSQLSAALLRDPAHDTALQPQHVNRSTHRDQSFTLGL